MQYCWYGNASYLGSEKLYQCNRCQRLCACLGASAVCVIPAEGFWPPCSFPVSFANNISQAGQATSPDATWKTLLWTLKRHCWLSSSSSQLLLSSCIQQTSLVRRPHHLRHHHQNPASCLRASAVSICCPHHRRGILWMSLSSLPVAEMSLSFAAWLGLQSSLPMARKSNEGELGGDLGSTSFHRNHTQPG